MVNIRAPDERREIRGSFGSRTKVPGFCFLVWAAIYSAA
jgi:hypothetical protein